MIYQLFLENLRSTPDATAIVTSSSEKYTYFTANQKVNAWANYLIKQGVEARDRVGVLLDNEDNHIFILLALDKINAAYVPFDTDIPKGQLPLDIADLGLKKCIIEQGLCSDFAVDKDIQIPVPPEGLSGADALECHEPSRPYDTNGFEKTTYIVSSSGSTGKKKWIPIMGAGISYWADVVKHQMGMHAADKVLATRSPAYDARIFEYVCAFSGGGTLHLLNRIERKDTSRIEAACKSAHITSLLMIASQLNNDHCESLV